MPIVGLHHAGLSVPDLEAAVAFYTEVLGLRLVQRQSWKDSPVADAIVDMPDSAASVAILWAGNAVVELFEYRSPEPRPQDPNRPVADHGINHICLQVTDIHAEYERLRRRGMRFHTAPKHLDDGWATYGRDPWGNVIELQEIDDPTVPTVDGSWEFASLPDTTY